MLLRIDRWSKYRKKIIKVLHYFTVPKILVTDNERSFLSPLIESLIKSLGIKLYLTPVQRSEVNGQVERLHSTIIEIYRCLRVEYPNLSVKELIEVCVDRYNNTIHSTTKKRPCDLFLNRNVKRITKIFYQNKRKLIRTSGSYLKNTWQIAMQK